MALTQTQVSQLYVSILGRASEGEGNAYWMANGDTMASTADTMLSLDVAKDYFGATLDDNQLFIEFIYENTLGKTYAEDPDGVDYWVAKLEGGESKGDLIAELIDAAMDPAYTGLAAQDQFINKVAVSNYTAETIAAADPADLSAFVGFISGVTEDAATVTAAENAVDAEAGIINFALTSDITNVDEGGSITYTVTATAAVETDTAFIYTLSSAEASAVDFTSGTSGVVTIVAGETTGTFSINIAENDGAEFSEAFTVTVKDSSHTEIGSIEATINDTSTNDTIAPVIAAGQSADYNENSAITDTLITVAASDSEGTVDSYAIASGNDDGFFAIDASGNITLTETGVASAANDFETGDNAFTLGVTATDNAGNTSAPVDVTLGLNDIDDVAPTLSTSTFGANIATLTYSESLDAASLPAASDFFVTVQGQAVTIGINSVTISGNQVSLDLGRAPAAGETFLVDYTPGTNPLQDAAGNQAAAINDAALISDTAAPVIDAGQSFTYQEESIAADETIGTLTASDDVGITSFAIDAATDPDGFFAIDNNGVITLTAAGAAANVASNDYETAPNLFTLSVTASDGAGNTDTENVTVTITNNVTDDGEQFTLSTGTDAGAAYTGSSGDDVFYATEDTLTSNDHLDGGDGDADLLDYASSGAAAVNEAGFTLENIERIQVTADAVAGTTFDVTDTTSDSLFTLTLINDNSAYDLTFTGAQELFNLEMLHVGGAADGDADTTVDYQAGIIAGDTIQNVTLNDVLSSLGSDAGILTVNGIETFNLTATGEASHLTGLASTSLQTVNVAGDQNLTIDAVLNGATTVNAGTFEGNLSVVADSATAAKDVVITGGIGDDTADFSAGFETGDSFDGGDGTDTLGLTNAVAVGTPAGTVSNVEILDITTSGTGTVDMDNFAGIEKVIYNAGITAAATATVDDAVTGLTVEVDVNGVGTENLVVDLKTDGTADELTIVLDEVAAGNAIASVNAADAETLNISVDDDTADGTGAMTITTLTATDATTLNLSGDADLTITGTVDPATPVLATINAADLTGDLTISATNTAAAGATITLGAGDDTFNVATSNGGDTITLGAGADIVVYTATAQSDTDMDTITDFVSGTDKIDLSSVAGNPVVNFLGNQASFGQAQGALSGDAVPASGLDAVFQVDDQILWVDVDDNGTLDNNDLRIKLDGVSALVAADVGIAAGNTVTLTAAGQTVNLTSTVPGATTNQNDTINATAAFANGSTINGGIGTDTLNITTDLNTDLSAATVDLTNVAGGQALDMALTSIEKVVFSNVAAATDITIAGRNNGEDITVDGADGALTVTGTAIGQDFVVSNTIGTTASTITLGVFATQTATLGAAADTVNLSAVSATVNTGAGNDTIIMNNAGADGSTVDGGAGTADTLLVTGVNAVLTDGTYSNIEILDLTTGGATAETVTLAGTGFNTILFGDVGDVVTLTTSQLNALTTLTQSADADGVIVISDTGAVDISGIAYTNDVDKITLSAAGNSITVDFNDLASIDEIIGAAGTDTLIIDLDAAATVDDAVENLGKVTFMENLTFIDSASTGNNITSLTLANASGITTIDASAVTGTIGLTLTGLTTASGDTTITLGSGVDAVTNLKGGANNLTLDFGAGNATVTDLAAVGAGVIELNIDNTVGSTTTIAFAATTADFATGDIFDFNLDVNSIVATGASNANQAIITNDGTNSKVLFDVNGDNAFGAGDIEITIAGQVLTDASFSIVNNDLVFV